MTRNPYRTAMGTIGASAAGLGALTWLLATLALTGNYSSDPGVIAWQSIGGFLFTVGAVLSMLWWLVCALTYRDTHDVTSAPAEIPASTLNGR